MEKVKEILGIALSWAGVFCFALFTAVSFPSFGTILFLIGLTICLPLRVTRNFWNKKGLRGASKIALIAALIIAGAVMSPRKATETQSDAPEVIEESTSETNNAQTQPEQTLEVTVPESVSESEPVLEPEPVREPEPAPEPEPVPTSEPEIVEEAPNPLDELDPESVEYDALQKLYVTFPRGASFQEAVEFLDASGLPYSSVKYNGSRAFQVSTEEAGTAQKYNKSGLSYVEIHYRYPKDENSKNDVLEKYTFSGIYYVPNEGYFSFEGDGSIRRLGKYITTGRNLTREEQIAFFYQYKDNKTAFK